MLGRAKRREDNSIGPSTGLIKWITRFFRFVLYPFIHPVWFVSGLVIAVIAVVALPAYFGVEFKDSAAWYGKLFDDYYSKAETVVNDRLVAPIRQKAEDGIKKLGGQGVNVKKVEKKPGKAELVAYESPVSVNRRVFQKAQEIPVDVAATLENGRKQTGVYFKRNNSLGLTYLEEPKKITGEIYVVNANELRIGGELVFLYGIYVQPDSEEGLAAEKYLRDTLEGKNADCFVGAYAQDGSGTVICIYQGKNINQTLVDMNYSRNVTLN